MLKAANLSGLFLPSSPKSNKVVLSFLVKKLAVYLGEFDACSISIPAETLVVLPKEYDKLISACPQVFRISPK